VTGERPKDNRDRGFDRRRRANRKRLLCIRGTGISVVAPAALALSDLDS
jgi:hypothetical protein